MAHELTHVVQQGNSNNFTQSSKIQCQSRPQSLSVRDRRMSYLQSDSIGAGLQLIILPLSQCQNQLPSQQRSQEGSAPRIQRQSLQTPPTSPQGVSPNVNAPEFHPEIEQWQNPNLVRTIYPHREENFHRFLRFYGQSGDSPNLSGDALYQSCS